MFGGFSDQAMHDVLCDVVVTCVVVGGLVALCRGLMRSRPGLRLVAPVMTAAGIRILTIFAVSQASFAQTIRGPDEAGYLANALGLSQTPFGSGDWTTALTKQLFLWVFAVEDFVMKPPDDALRILQTGFTVGGFALMAFAVYELAGPRAARLAAWILAFEPASMLFGSVLGKEPLLYLAEGLVIFGLSRLWRRGTIVSLLPVLGGIAIALGTRPYAGWFLIAATAVVVLHLSLRGGARGGFRGMALLAGVVALAAVGGPFVYSITSSKSLEDNLQSSQTANATDQSNLKLDEVDFSSRDKLFTNLPQRIRDVVVKPYPWQVSTTNQKFGLLGTVAFLVAFTLLLRYFWLSRGSIMRRAGPFIYLGGFLLVAYSLSAGNAGTAFRYRTHVLVLAICLLVILREWLLADGKIVPRSARARLPVRFGPSRAPSPGVGGVAASLPAREEKRSTFTRL